MVYVQISSGYQFWYREIFYTHTRSVTNIRLNLNSNKTLLWTKTNQSNKSLWEIAHHFQPVTNSVHVWQSFCKFLTFDMQKTCTKITSTSLDTHNFRRKCRCQLTFIFVFENVTWHFGFDVKRQVKFVKHTHWWPTLGSLDECWGECT